MTRPEMLAIDRRWYLSGLMFFALLAGVAVANRDWPIIVVCALLLGYTLHALTRTITDELAEARRGWRPARGLHVIDGGER